MKKPLWPVPENQNLTLQIHCSCGITTTVYLPTFPRDHCSAALSNVPLHRVNCSTSKLPNIFGAVPMGVSYSTKKLGIRIMFPSPDIKKGRGHHVGTDKSLQNQAPKSPSSCRLRMWDLWRHTALSTNHWVWASCWGQKIPWIWRITPLQSPRSSKDHMCFNPLGLIPWNSWGKTIFAAQLDEVQWFVC